MGEAKFTPGPWYAEADEDFGWRGEPRESEHISIYSSCNDEEDDGLVASVALVSGEFGAPVAGWANAHIIAATPDLYDFARTFHDGYDGWSDAELERRCDPATLRLVRQCRAALAKACPTPAILSDGSPSTKDEGAT